MAARVSDFVNVLIPIKVFHKRNLRKLSLLLDWWLLAASSMYVLMNRTEMRALNCGLVLMIVVYDLLIPISNRAELFLKRRLMMRR